MQNGRALGDDTGPAAVTRPFDGPRADHIGFSRLEAQFGETRLAIWVAGPSAAPVLVVNHGGALDHSAFRDLALQLSDRWRVVLWDLPGHGESQPRPKPFTASICAEAMAVAMEQAGANNAVVLGFSFGGVVAQVLAKRRPDLVSRLIAYGCLSPHVGRPLAPPTAVPGLVRALFGLKSWPAIRQRFGELCSVTETGRARVAAEMAPVGKAGFLAMAIANLAASDRDPAFRIPGGVDLLAGALDSNGDAIWRTFRAFEAAYPNAQTIIIPGAGHCAHLDQPSAFAQAMERLLDPTR